MKYLLLVLLLTGCVAMGEEITTVDYETAYFAGGCFWCMEAAFEAEEGVFDAINGYAGGTRETAEYYKVGSGTTNHVEAVEVRYDPKIISYEKLVEVFWRQIDPTDAEGQFADRGPEYRAAIMYKNEEEKMIAEKSKKELSESGKFDKPIVTDIEKFNTFFPAEEEHQNYYKKRVLQYNAYAEGSGRKGFIKDTWSE